MRTKRLIAFAAALLFAGCSLDKQAAPSLIGPSELGLSVGVTATPDFITQDGQSQATIQVTARDASSQPVSGLTLRAEIYVGSTAADFGTLSAKTFSTGGDGRASISYRAPAAPPPSAQDDNLVTILVTPVGTNYAASISRAVEIRLTRPGVIIPPGDAPQVAFLVSPTSPRELDDVFFDASATTGNIGSYSWNFGDGGTGSGVTASHRYNLAGTYTVALTVRDTVGRTATKSVDVQVTAVSNPTASFTFSPTTPKAGDTVFFNGSASKAASGHAVTTYTWDFGDGSPLVGGGSPQVSHAFAGSATVNVSYVVVLTINDDANHTVTTSATVVVAHP